MPGSVANIALILDTETIIALVVNSSHLGDAADWSSQMILEEIFEPSTRHPYDQKAGTVALNIHCVLNPIGRELNKNRRRGTRLSHPLADYSGTFWSDTFNFKIDICVLDKDLLMTFNGAEAKTYILRHYEDDTWSWWMDYDETCRRGWAVHVGNAEFFLMRFEGTHRLLWRTGDFGSQVSVFIKHEVHEI